MKLFIVFSLVAGAAAFAPASQTASPSTSTPPATAAGPALRMSSYFEDELGAQPPLGFFDPAGFVANGDQDKFDRLRAVELKHGRVSMLAMVGYLVTEAGARLPGTIDLAGTIKFSSIPSGFAALAAVPQSGLVQIAAFVGFLEVAVMRDVTGEGEHIGDFRNGALDFGWDIFSPEEKERKRAIELNNGRAAMMGILALLVHEQLGVSILPSLTSSV